MIIPVQSKVSAPSNNHILFISGGARSGKSCYAEQRAEVVVGKRSYIATCPVIDAEMDERIAEHRRQRAGKGWHTIEEPLQLAQALRDCSDSDVVVVDCLTLWVNNLLYQAEQQQQTLSEHQISMLSLDVIESAKLGERTVVFVTNEVGMGLVPASAVSRCYRDLIGRCNQTIAAQADEAVFMVSGLPFVLKTI
ncbi:MAG: bifunctional adenosylcobinamide kinase/adenosylcobinamide-phosphate guanylyltransferase [Desulfobacteraceae bacterium 4572_35.1]|nr:MAG: bifunctional adenosylcobinamide kinase/adenosylcobinamide-phosphate guanylyltransferase [Desulfobacteraceae bacterium 4572_35.1]